MQPLSQGGWMQVPVLMHGQIVTWIDSKAMFGSERYHM